MARRGLRRRTAAVERKELWYGGDQLSREERNLIRHAFLKLKARGAASSSNNFQGPRSDESLDSFTKIDLHLLDILEPYAEPDNRSLLIAEG